MIIKHDAFPLSELQPYENNAKLHPPEQIAHLAKSIEKFGFTVPILVDHNNVIVSGHGRCLAAQFLGMTTAPVWQMPSLPPEKVNSLRLILNKLQADTGFDMKLMEFEIDKILSLGEYPLEELGIDFSIGSIMDGGESPYADQSIRQLICRYQSDVFAEVVAEFQRLAKDLKLESNSDVLTYMLNSYARATGIPEVC